MLREVGMKVKLELQEPSWLVYDPFPGPKSIFIYFSIDRAMQIGI